MSRPWLRNAGAALLAAGTGACTARPEMLDPHGPAARDIATLGWASLWLSFIVVLVVVFLLLYPLLTPGRPDRSGSSVGTVRFVVIAGFAIPAVVLFCLYVYNLWVIRAVAEPPTPTALTIEITGRQWWWDIVYKGGTGASDMRTANQMHLPVGRAVRLVLQSADVIHSFWVPQLQGKIDVFPRRQTTMWIQADEPGVYRGRCAEFCGPQHANMRLLVVAQPPGEFDSWLRHQRQPAADPPDAFAARGRDAFMANGCVVCHTIRGTPARGYVAPDLTHLASRQRIAAGTLDNRIGNLEAWIAGSEHIKPGNHMPSFKHFDGQTLRALGSYLHSLE